MESPNFERIGYIDQQKEGETHINVKRELRYQFVNYVTYFKSGSF